MIVVVTRQVETDIEAIGEHIADASPERAISFLRELREACEGLGDMPKRFPLVPRYEPAGIRRRVHGNYLIFYRIGIETVDVIHVLHGAMDYEALLFPEG